MRGTLTVHHGSVTYLFTAAGSWAAETQGKQGTTRRVRACTRTTGTGSISGGGGVTGESMLEKERGGKGVLGLFTCSRPLQRSHSRPKLLAQKHDEQVHTACVGVEWWEDLRLSRRVRRWHKVQVADVERFTSPHIRQVLGPYTVPSGRSGCGCNGDEGRSVGLDAGAGREVYSERSSNFPLLRQSNSRVTSLTAQVWTL